MSRRNKRNKRNNRNNNRSRQSEPRINSSVSDINKEIENFNTSEAKIAQQEGINPEPAEILQEVQQADLLTLYKQTQGTKSIFEQLIKKYEGLKEELERNSIEVAEKAQHLQENQQKQNEREQLLIKLDAEITEREADAAAGYLKQYETVLNEVKVRIEGLREAYTGFGTEISDIGDALLEEHRGTLNALIDTQRKTLTELREDYQSAQDELIKHWKQEKQELDERESQLVEREKALNIEERRLKAERDIQRENEEEREIIAEEWIELKTQDLQKSKDDLARLNKDLRAQLDQRNEEIRQWDSLIALFDGERDPEKIKNLVRDRVAEETKKVKVRYRSQDFENSERQLADKQESIRRLTDELDQLKQRNALLERQNSSLQKNAWELEDAYLERAALEKSRALLRARLEDLQNQIDRVIDDQTQSARPFEQCSEMDSDIKLQTASNTEIVEDLAKFARDVQANMEHQGFFYEARDVRSFIGGLAMSNLMILQGISGTGKTSLPIQFSKAVGGICEVIEVQSSWRDREDLIGYYNSFERRFHERAMLTALYQAQCPQNRDRIFIILLDEMNLSYPEQYFADFLSVLERQDITNDATLEIVSKHIDQRELPEHLDSDHRGVRLRIPSNVWFVGTANRDETTKDIADKTYDRSHIMELPNRRPESKGGRENKEQEFIPIIECGALTKLFSKAELKKDNRQVVDDTLSFLNSMRESMAQTLPLMWGNRLEKQIRRYIPVILDCGGNASEAIDHILAMRILRKLRNRYDVDIEGLQELQKYIDNWSMENKDLERSQKLLANEIRQKQRRY